MTNRVPPPGPLVRDASSPFAQHAAGYLFSRGRWLATVVLEIALGLFFLLAPHLTLGILGAEDSPSMAALFQIYGAILMQRGITQQIFYRRRDLQLFRRFLWTGYPFSVGSTVVLTYAMTQGLMSPLIGWIVVAAFAWDIVDNSVILWATRGLVTVPLVPEELPHRV